MNTAIRILCSLALLAGGAMVFAGTAAAEGDIKIHTGVTGVTGVTVDTDRPVEPKPYLFNPPPEPPSIVDQQRATHRELELKNAITDYERGTSSQDPRTVIQLRGERERMERLRLGEPLILPPAQSIRTTKP